MKNRRASRFLEDITSVRLVCEKKPGTSQWIFLEYFLSSCWFFLSNNRKEIWEEKLQLLPQQRELIMTHCALLFFHFICLGFVGIFIFAGVINYYGKSTPGNWYIPLPTGRFPYNCRWCQLFWFVTILSPVAFPFPCYRTQILRWRHWPGTWAICRQCLPLSSMCWLKLPPFTVPQCTIMIGIFLSASMVNVLPY